MRGLKINKQTRQEKNIKDATKMENMRPVFSGRDIPLAPTPAPKILAVGVVVPKKNEKEEFSYLTKKEKSYGNK